MSIEDRRRWDAKYAQRSPASELSADAWLIESTEPIPPGRALDLATGLGHNAIWLATQGWSVDAVDVSPNGLRLAARMADRHRVAVGWVAADLDHIDLPSEAYDLVVVFRFLERTRLPELISQTLRPGGLLVYETFNVRHRERFPGAIRNPAFLLECGELPGLFPQLDPISFVDIDMVHSSVSRLLARKAC